MRQLLVVLAAAVVLAAFAPAAAADQPVKSQYPVSGEYTMTGMTGACDFDVNVAFSANITETDFYVKGVPTKLEWHAVEQDTLSANGKSLTSLPYTFSLQMLFDSTGATTRWVTHGVVEKVPLPDGRLFITAGRINWAAHPVGTPFILTPDNGATVNLHGFCAALAP